MEKTSQDSAYKRKVVPLRIWEPLFIREPRYENPEKFRHTRANENINLVTRVDITKKMLDEVFNPSQSEIFNKFAYIFGASELFSGSGTPKNGVNPLRFWLNTKVLDDAHCKTNKSHKWEYASRDRRQVSNLWEENPPHQPTPRRAALASAIPNIADRPTNVSTRHKNAWRYGLRWTLERFIK